MVEVRKQAISDNFSRRDDASPYWGGAGITLSAPSARCSAGYTVKNAVGTRFMVTAGHCFTNGQTAVTELGGRVVGTVSGNGLPAQDMELIGGQSYGSSIYVGGVNSSTGNIVVSAADPVVGFTDYCHTGRTTDENCGHTVNSVNALVCTSSGCKSPAIAFTGGNLPQGGDSGSPFYAKSASAPGKHIRGHIIAGNGGEVESRLGQVRCDDRDLSTPDRSPNRSGADFDAPLACSGHLQRPRAPRCDDLGPVIAIDHDHGEHGV